ncbi:N-acetylmuramoyl-L-alanine amidase [Paenibacillus nasutitermitis]|uniref:MurNAc-LAA domain-containing protein n=1 Tax=Paenibacillus nasutitermitis TaxID=1652958 RepID=A0A917DS38_9BACL|nr:N-acetylmuramoyl-L-alanine amidase [Paenibacillus nasutitermitis]GGD64789.1 hypothetical protein GCM10010911_23220 [Paenibacillus nasutitermitis]
MKKFVTAVLLLTLFVSMFPVLVGAAAEPVPKLILNGKQLQPSAAPRIVKQYTMVPVRVVSEELGFGVDWSSPNVYISNGDTTMVLTIGSKTALVNEKKVSLDAPAMISKSTTLVPLRFIGEQFGLEVSWEDKTKTVNLTSPVQEEKPPVVLPGEEEGNTGNEEGTEPGSGGTVTDGTEPANSSATINAIDYDGLGSIYVNYDGDIGELVQETIASTGEIQQKIAIDFPSTAFSSTFKSGLSNGYSGQISMDGHPSLVNVRYSLYKDKPPTVRIVLDLKVSAPINIVREGKVIRIDMQEPTEVVTPSPPAIVEPPIPGVYKVVLDAGHGAKDPGASAVNGKTEKEFNLAITLKVKALLDKEPKINAILTRSDDTFVELNDRAKIANDLKADIFISFHGNSASPSATGTETYYNRADSLALANVIHKHLVAGTGLPDRKVRQAGFVVIKKTTMPAVLLESGYLSNKGDAAVLFDPARQDAIAAEVVAGIKEYLNIT